LAFLEENNRIYTLAHYENSSTASVGLGPRIRGTVVVCLFGFFDREINNRHA